MGSAAGKRAADVAKDSIRPMALGLGAVTMFAMALLYNKESNRCVEFPHLWKNEGPLHLQQWVQDEAFELAAAKLRAADAAGSKMTLFELRDALLTHFEPKCSWGSIENERGRKIVDSFADIARYSIGRFYGGLG